MTSVGLSATLNFNWLYFMSKNLKKANDDSFIGPSSPSYSVAITSKLNHHVIIVFVLSFSVDRIIAIIRWPNETYSWQCQRGIEIGVTDSKSPSHVTSVLKTSRKPKTINDIKNMKQKGQDSSLIPYFRSIVT